MQTETTATLDGLATDALALLDRAPGLISGGLFSGRAWWDVGLAHALPADAEACFVTLRSRGQVVALVPMLRQRGRLASLTTPYSCEYEPLFATGTDSTTRVAAMAAFARFCRGSGVTRLDALPAEWDGWPDLLSGVRQAGLRALRFDHFGNWHEDVSGLGWPAYLHARPGALRETVRRRLRRAEAVPGARFALLTQPADMDKAAEAFES